MLLQSCLCTIFLLMTCAILGYSPSFTQSFTERLNKSFLSSSSITLFSNLDSLRELFSFKKVCELDAPLMQVDKHLSRYLFVKCNQNMYWTNSKTPVSISHGQRKIMQVLTSHNCRKYWHKALPCYHLTTCLLFPWVLEASVQVTYHWIEANQVLDISETAATSLGTSGSWQLVPGSDKTLVLEILI